MQTWLQPWRTRIVNALDAGLTGMFLIMLIVGALDPKGLALIQSWSIERDHAKGEKRSRQVPTTRKSDRIYRCDERGGAPNAPGLTDAPTPLVCAKKRSC